MANPSVVVEFIASTQKLVDSVKDVEKAGTGASNALSKINWRSVAKWTGVAVAAGATVKLLKSASDHVVDLAKSTLTLERATNLDAKTASAWVEILKVRGIETSAFQTSLVKLSRQMETSRKAQADLAFVTKNYNQAAAELGPVIARGGKAGKEAEKSLKDWGKILDKASSKAQKANEPFEQMGVNLRDVRKGNIQAVLLQMADGFSKLTNPAQRAALAQQLFGRQGQKLLPILLKGSKGIQEQLKLAEKYGATLGSKTVKQVANLAEKQRELQLAQDGVKNSIGSALLPAQVSLYGSLLKLINVVLPLSKNVTLMKVALIAAAVAMIAYKVAVIASTIASLGLNAAMLPEIALFAAIAVGVAALIAVAILLYKNWGKVTAAFVAGWKAIKAGAMTAISWLRANWPLILGILLGPFALSIVLIIRNWDRIVGVIKAAASGAINWLRANWQTIVAILAGPLGVAVLQIARHWDAIKAGAQSVLERVRSVFGAIAGAVRSAIGAVASAARAMAQAIATPINAVIAAINAIKLEVKIAKRKLPGPIPDIPGISFSIDPFPQLAPIKLARGGIVSSPTLAMLGEAGPEAVVPLGGPAPIEVRVFIGDQELRGLVRTEVRTENTRTAQVLLAGRVG